MSDKELFAFVIKHYQIIEYEINRKDRDDVPRNSWNSSPPRSIEKVDGSEFTLENVMNNTAKWNEVISDRFDHNHRLSSDHTYSVYRSATMWDMYVWNNDIELTYELCKYLYSIEVVLGDFYEKETSYQKEIDFGRYSYQMNGLRVFRNKRIKDKIELQKIINDHNLLSLFFSYEYFNQDVVDYVIKIFFNDFSLSVWGEIVNLLKNRDIHNYVDLGLSVMWASCNLGANSPLDTGLCFQWGEPFQNSQIDETIYYKQAWMERNSVDIANSRFDAAYMIWGGYWHLPNIKECDELLNKCIWETINIDDKVMGYKITGPNGNNILLPINSSRYYLTSMRGSTYPFIHALYIDSSKHYIAKPFECDMASIRPVFGDD